MKEKLKKLVVLGIAIVVLIVFYFLAQKISPDYLQEVGLSLPLPVFTFLVAIIDGFNPCNLFILTLLVSLLLTESHERKRIYAVGYTFIAVVFLFYFLFMAAWLNIFRYIGLIDPLRIGIAVIALIAGFINCKELFFYRKGITLMVQDKHVGPLKKRIAGVSKLIKTGSIPTLIGASIVLAIFASLVELPCTAGFPIIYTGILSGMGLGSGLGHYLYLLLYGLIYVLPLFVIMTVLGYTFNGKTIKKQTMGLIKFIGGLIMIILGIVLLVNPGLIGVG
ncbi:MAG: hypothetical protein KJ718_02085 [Nanoarchaeota archaeon]|nr:hypothetical protein [Nanoarchaeota archaeon]MBU1988448.1 hypothetical protein [Nanoarchaeota archaeon]